MNDIILPGGVIYLMAVFFIIFVIREIVAFKKILPLKYVFTPLVTYTVIAIALYLSISSGFSRYDVFIIAGLLFALIADTFLMIEEMSFFKHGLLFFLLTHVCYIYALSIGYTISSADLIILVFIAMFAVMYYVMIHRTQGKRNIPVMLYMLVLSLVLMFGVGAFIKSFSQKSILIMAAAILFTISDAVLAYNQFVRKIPHSTVVTWSLYAPAQLLFALSCYY